MISLSIQSVFIFSFNYLPWITNYQSVILVTYQYWFLSASAWSLYVYKNINLSPFRTLRPMSTQVNVGMFSRLLARCREGPGRFKDPSQSLEPAGWGLG
jgi:hypothetical protein